MCDDEKTILNPMRELAELKKAFDGAVALAEDTLKLAHDIERDLTDCHNELCLKCGKYTESYKGACKGCRWEW